MNISKSYVMELANKLEYIADRSGNGAVIHDARLVACILSNLHWWMQKGELSEGRRDALNKSIARAEKFLVRYSETRPS